MTPSVAVVMLAHDEPLLVRRILRALDPLPVFLHCDAGTPDGIADAMIGGSEGRVWWVQRIRTHRGDWSLVEAELAGVRGALDHTDAEWIVVMSGSCYPLLSVDELARELQTSPGLSRINSYPLPHEPWATRFGMEGGLWRLQLRFRRFHGRPMRISGRPVPIGRAVIPEAVVPYGGSEWKVYSRRDATTVLDCLRAHPEIRDFFRHSFTPDESCVPSILNSPRLNPAPAPAPANPWFVRFPAASDARRTAHGHSDWIDEDALPELIEASRPGLGHERALFARKVRADRVEWLDRIDRELRR